MWQKVYHYEFMQFFSAVAWNLKVKFTDVFGHSVCI